MIKSRADHQKRVLVPQARPGEVYAIQDNANGSFTLTVVDPTEPARLKCHVSKENGFTVVVPGQPIDEQAIKELLADFP